MLKEYEKRRWFPHLPAVPSDSAHIQCWSTTRCRFYSKGLDRGTDQRDNVHHVANNRLCSMGHKSTLPDTFQCEIARSWELRSGSSFINNVCHGLSAVLALSICSISTTHICIVTTCMQVYSTTISMTFFRRLAVHYTFLQYDCAKYSVLYAVNLRTVRAR